MINGNAELNIRPLTDTNARGILDEVYKMYTDVGQNVDSIQGASTDLFEVTEAATSISIDSQDLLGKSQALSAAFVALPGKRPGGLGSNLLNAALGIASVVFLAFAGLAYNSTQRRQST